MSKVHALAALMRPRVSLAVAGGSLFGAFYFGMPWDAPGAWRGLATALGAGILCAACSALNQVQEREADARMVRTRNRPLVAGILSVKNALVLSVTLFLAGFALFFLARGWPLLAVGIAVPVLYNGLYTPLKRMTPMALLVGALSGALPPLTGWIGAGGSMLDPTILAVTAIFYLWQVPHFWLLHAKHREDYLRAGFATLEGRLPHHLYKPMLVLWVSAYFLGLGCLAYASGPGAALWIVPPIVLIGGTWALHAIVRDHHRRAAVSLYASLPLVLVVLLGNTL